MMQTRRMFCGSALAMAGGGAVALLSPLDAAAQASAADPIQAHITAEFERLRHTFSAGAMRADDYRAGAINFRLWSAHAQSLDGELVRRVNEAVRREGRERLVSGARLRDYTRLHGAAKAVTYGALSAALDRLQQGGLPARLERLASGMDAMHGVVQRRSGVGSGSIVRTSGIVDHERVAHAAALTQEYEHWTDEALLYGALAQVSGLAPVFEPVREAASASAHLFGKAKEYSGY